MTSPRIDRRCFLAGALALAAPAVHAFPAAVETMTGPAFGTDWRLVLPAGRATGALGRAVVEVLRAIDAGMSPWRPDSLLSRVNAGAPGPVAITPEFARVGAAALAIARDSGGLFDPTVGPAVARWGFGPIQGSAADWRTLAVDPERLDRPEGGTLDFCGIAKGRAVDLVAEVLAARGEAAFLVEIGGELREAGRHPSGRAWQVAVADPRPGASGIAGAVPLDGLAVATSGVGVNSYAIGGRRVSHIIDPGRDAPVVAGPLLSVTVRAADAMTADGWATALMAAGPERGPDLARRLDLDALFLAEGAAPVATGRMRFTERADG